MAIQAKYACMLLQKVFEGDGSLQKPFATFARARDEVRIFKDKYKDEDIYVFIRGNILDRQHNSFCVRGFWKRKSENCSSGRDFTKIGLIENKKLLL